MDGQSINKSLKRYTVESFQTDEGLPGIFIVDITQDYQGYLWLASHSGLIRYDGYNFEQFVNIPGDSTSISRNWMESLFLASDSTLWIGTDQFVSRYFPQSGKFINYAYDPDLKDLLALGQVNDIVEDSMNNLWLSFQKGGLVCYESSTKQFKRYFDDRNLKQHLLDDQVRDLLWDSKNNLWIGTGEPFGTSIKGGGILKFTPKTGYVKRYTHDPQYTNSLIDNRIGAIYEDRNGKIWVGTCKSGLHWYDEDKDEFVRSSTDKKDKNVMLAPQGEVGAWSGCPLVVVITEDHLNRFWMGTFNGGLHLFDPSTGSLDHYYQNSNEPNGFTNDLIMSGFQDNQNRLWIGNASGGLYKFDAAKEKFHKLIRKPRSSNTLSGKHVVGIYQAPSDPDHLWIGTERSGVNQLNLKTGIISHFKHDPLNPTSLSNDGIWCFYEDLDGNFWIGTVDGLNLYAKKEKSFKHYRHDPLNENSLSGNGITALLEDQKNFLWIGTWGDGLNRIDKKSGKIERFSFGDIQSTSLQQSVYVLHIDKNNQFWVSTWKGGLYLFDYERKKFTYYLEGIGATSLWEDKNEIFWITTENSGLIKFNSKTRKIEKQFTIKDGLPTMATYRAIPDNYRNLWISSISGLICFGLDTEKITVYDVTDGLPDNTFSHQTGIKTIDGIIFFGTLNGLVFFNPDQISYNQIPPSLVINKVEINGTTYDSKSIGNKLNYNQRNITFSFTGIHFTKPLDNTYSYKLEPYDSGWSPVTKERTVRYTNLDPNKYIFYIKSANSDGVWTETPTSVSFEIRPPWWATWWAYSIYGLLILSVFYGIRTYELKRKLAHYEAARLKELDQVKSRLYTNITHEFRTPLSIILGVAGQVKKQVATGVAPHLDMIERNGRQLLQLVNQLLDLSKVDSGKFQLNYQQGDIINYLKYLVESFHSLAEQKAVELHFLSELDSLLMDYDPERLQQIFYNLLSNALKFTPEGGHIYFIVSTTLGVSDTPRVVTIKLKDTGVGIPEDQLTKIFDRFYQLDDSDTRRAEGTGIGLALVKELIKLMGGSIAVKSKPGQGTEFLLTIPIRHSATITTTREVKQLPVNGKTNPLLPIASTQVEGPKVLIIEDNRDVQVYIQNCLSVSYQVEIASDGEDGIQKAQKIIPDLIICDVMMPIKDGFEVCATLKQDRRTSHIPIVMLTAKADYQSKIQGLQHGADIYLAKPFQEEELLLHLHNLLLQRERLQQHYLFLSGLTEQPGDKQVYENVETDFVERVKAIILDHLTDSTFTVSQLSREMTLSQSQLHRKLTALTGYSASKLIRMIRLNHAKKLLHNQALTIASVAYDSGFNDPDYMSKIFKQEFGITPTEFRMEQKTWE